MPTFPVAALMPFSKLSRLNLGKTFANSLQAVSLPVNKIVAFPAAALLPCSKLS